MDYLPDAVYISEENMAGYLNDNKAYISSKKGVYSVPRS